MLMLTSKMVVVAMRSMLPYLKHIWKCRCFFIGSGADIGARGGRHNTALNAAVSSRAYLRSAVGGHSDGLMVVRLLIENGIEVNRSNCGRSGLMKASSAGHVELVKLLLDNVADVDTHDEEHGTALCAALYWVG